MQGSQQGRQHSFQSLSVAFPDSSIQPSTPSKRVALCSLKGAMAACKGIWTKAFWRAVAGEFLATLFFVLISIGSSVGWGGVRGPTDILLISLCFGLSIATMVQGFGHISGGHLNPAVTAAMVCSRDLNLAKGVFYVLAQCLGAIAGAGILYLVTPAGIRGTLGVTSINENLSAGHGLLVEMLITFQLLFTIYATCDSRRDDLKGSSALAIGLSVAIGHMFAINYTGAGMNPARSFGPAVIMGKWANHWVYWVGPTMGGVVAAAFYKYLFCPDKEMKNHFKDTLRPTQAPGDKYSDAEEGKGQTIECVELAVTPGSSRSLDGFNVEAKKKDKTEELLTPV